MSAKSIHLSYLALLAILAITVTVHFPFSMYFFATVKAAIILFFFMHVARSETASRLYLFMAFALLLIGIAGFLDDVIFR